MKKNLRYFMTLLLMMVASVGWAEDVTDVLTRATTGITGTSYTNWIGKTATSDAVYAGNSAGGNTSIQLRSKNNESGIVSTASGGKLKKIVVTWEGHTADGRTLNVYGRNTAYSAATDLYDESNQGTLLGTIVYGTSTELTVNGDYQYVGLRSNSDAMYLSEVKITWEVAASSVEKPTFDVPAGTYTESQTVTITCGTPNVSIYYTTDGTDPDNNTSNLYSSPISINTNTTLKAIAYDTNGKASSVASATYTIVALQTIAQVRALGSGTVYTQGIVTSCVGTTAYVQDETAAICVYGQALTVGDKINVQGTLSTYEGLLEIINPSCTTISSGNAVTPTVKTIAEINSDFSNGNTLQGWLVKIEEATVTAINESNTTIAQGENTIVVRGISNNVALNNKITLQGNIGCYKAVQIVNPSNVTIVSAGAPNINADNNVVLAYNATSGEIPYTIDNHVEGVNLTASCTDDADWISNITVESDKVKFTATENNGNEVRTAYIKLSYTGAEDVIVTVTQKKYAPDYAELPFEFDGGKGDIETKDGLTQEGLDSDYDSSPKLKFNGTDDKLILKINERPGTLTFDIKGNGFSGGTFKVMTSEDGSTYTDLETYTELGATQNESFNNLGENVRFIKWVYTEKVSGNVALGNISLAKYVAPQNYTLTIPSIDNVTITASYGTDQLIEEGESEEIVQGTEITLTVDAAEGYTFDNLAVTDGGENSFTPSPVSGSEGAYRFTMPSYNATISLDVTEYVAPVTTTYKLATSITSGKHYVIASGTSGDVMVMGEQRSNNRGAVEAEITDDVLKVSEAYDFVIEGSSTDGYTIFDADADAPGYLYAASSSANQLKTQAENDVNGIWTITFDALSGAASIKAEGSENRNVMQYNSNSTLFACYASASQGAVYLFEKVEDTPAVATTIDLTNDEVVRFENFSNVSSTDFQSDPLLLTATNGKTYKFTANNVKNSDGGLVFRTGDNLGYISTTVNSLYGYTVRVEREWGQPHIEIDGNISETKDALSTENTKSNFKLGSSSSTPLIRSITFYPTIKLTVGETGYATIYYSDRDISVVSNQGAVQFEASTYKLDENGALVPSKTYLNIPHEEAVVLKGTPNKDYLLSTDAPTLEKDAKNLLKGSDVEEMTTGGIKYYALATNANGDADSVGFYWQAEDGGAFTNGAHKAYLALPADTGAKSAYLFSEDISTGINGVNKSNNADVRYNMQGQRVGNAYKGVVIKNGKKFLQK